MSVFVISDLHLSFGANKPMDVFGARWAGFEEKLESAWRERVCAADTVVIPGDVSWGMTLAEALPDFAFLDALPGEKILLKGNHDYYWNTAAKLSAFLTENGFSTIRFLHNNAFLRDGLILCGSRGWSCEEEMSQSDRKILAREAGRFSLSLAAGQKLRAQDPDAAYAVFSHYPLSGGAQNPIVDVLLQYGVSRVFYGHLHMVNENALPKKWQDGISFSLVAADYLGFVPQKIS